MKSKKKYKLLGEGLKAVSNGDLNLLILHGDAGFGKTRSTMDMLKDNNVDYEYINSYTTPLSFYKLLYLNRNKDVIVFDDISSIGNSLIISLLKSACWTSEGNSKIVSYHSTSNILVDDEVPESFKFKASVVLIFNDLVKGYEPIINRGIKINFNFNFEDKISIFEDMKKKANIDDEVLNYVKENCSEATRNLSIRTLVVLSNLKEAGHDFKLFADEILGNDEDVEDLLKMSVREWSEKTGLTKRTYYRRKKRLGLK